MQARVMTPRFDARTGHWEARVDVERDGRTGRYPCRIPGPESAPRDWLEAALTRQALAMSDTPAPQPPRPSLLARLTDALGHLAHADRALSGIPVRIAHRPR